MLLWEWATREGALLLSWWLFMTLAGAAALPLCFSLLGGLPDRGYTLARALGMLLVTFVFWLLNCWGQLDNSSGSIVFSWLLTLLAALAVQARRRARLDLRAWWRENRSAVLLFELLFIVMFVGWAFYRAHQNDLNGTEKPMELAFLSAAQRSPSLPPADPWLAGYAISYYYMGYIMSAALSLLSGVSSAIGFNLTNAALFALAGSTAFGVAYNLQRSRARGLAPRKGSRSASRIPASLTGLLAALMLVLMGNFQLPLIELPFNSRTASAEYFDFWGLDGRSGFAENAYRQEADASLSLDTRGWEWWWWFRASRVLADYDLAGNRTGTQPIDEFPAFSFLLADNHPHVLALPFAVTAMGLMLNLLLRRREPDRGETLLYGIAVGGLAFLNAWDGAIYLCGFVGAEALRRIFASARDRLTVWDLLAAAWFGARLTLVAAIAYLPYIIGFRSQAGGILPNLAHPTYFPRFFIMFAPFIVILGIYLLVESWRGQRSRRFNWQLGLRAALLIFFTLLAAMALLGAVIAIANPGYAESLSPGADTGELLQRLAQRRAAYLVTTLVLLGAIALVVARLFPFRRRLPTDSDVAVIWIRFPRSTGFCLLLIGMGLCLTLFPEFFYLKDNFGVRINTIFKFYYQAWALWSIAAAYAIYSIFADSGQPRLHRLLRLPLSLLVAACIGAGLLYLPLGIKHRAWIETGRHNESWRLYQAPAEWQSALRQVADAARVQAGTVLYSRLPLAEATEDDLLRSNHSGIVSFAGEALHILEPLSLDGAAGLLPQDEQIAIACLSALAEAPDVVVAEAVLGSYDIRYGRVGALTGIPIVLGWENHERQWRGATYNEIAGARRGDLETLYRSGRLEDAMPVIERYGITYILYGETERQVYGSQGEQKFRDWLPIVCQAGESRVYYTGAYTGGAGR